MLTVQSLRDCYTNQMHETLLYQMGKHAHVYPVYSWSAFGQRKQMQSIFIRLVSFVGRCQLAWSDVKKNSCQFANDRRRHRCLSGLWTKSRTLLCKLDASVAQASVTSTTSLPVIEALQLQMSFVCISELTYDQKGRGIARLCQRPLMHIMT